MINYFKSKYKSDFAKSVTLLASGAFIGQSISLFTAPILTRLYSPAEFGIFAVFSAIVSILLLIATGQYEFAITLPKKEENVNAVVYLVWFMGIISSLIIFVLSLGVKTFFLSFFKFMKYDLIIYLIPLAVLIFS